MKIPSAAGYADEAARLFQHYESIDAETVHRHVRHLIPEAPCDVLDVGAGTGRDAAWLARLGHRVLAVEPTDALRHGAQQLHPSPRIEWLDDALPALPQVWQTGRTFDVVMLSAVWMHLDPGERRAAMPVIASLIRPGGVVILSLRHGPISSGRRMFDVTPQETTALAAADGLVVVLDVRVSSLLPGKPDVHWDRLAFRAEAPIAE